VNLTETAALVVVDLQERLRTRGVAGFDAVVARTADLARAFRATGRPVVLVTVGDDVPVPELEPHEDDLRVTKPGWSALTRTGLDAELRARGVTQLVLTGVATSIGVESTARSARDLGYELVLVTDAVADVDPDEHAHSLARILPRLGELSTAAEVRRAAVGGGP
jgi:nicotinamidase-related amidase